MEIVLIRHGKPTAAVNPKLSASGFVRWVRHYNLSKVDTKSKPPKGLADNLAEHFIVTSDLPRSLDSANLCAHQKVDLTLQLLREMEIPRYKLPFKLKANTWLIVNRILWLLGFNGNVESFKTAKARAKTSAKQLQELTLEHKKIAVFGHLLMNRYIAKELKKAGWNRSCEGRKYWDATKLDLVRKKQPKTCKKHRKTTKKITPI